MGNGGNKRIQFNGIMELQIKYKKSLACQRGKNSRNSQQTCGGDCNKCDTASKRLSSIANSFRVLQLMNIEVLLLDILQMPLKCTFYNLQANV